MKHLILLLILSLIPASILFSQSTQKKEVEGFTQILTEKKLGDWDGNPDYWRFEDGVLIGEVPGASPLQGNIFYRWEKKVKDFELKVVILDFQKRK